jgi:hypothetical protein
MNESLKKKIEARAYQLFLKRGGAHGYHHEDWARAEKEVMAEESGAKSVSAPKSPTQPQKTTQPTQPKKAPVTNRK